jgi:hypothetical protein
MVSERPGTVCGRLQGSPWLVPKSAVATVRSLDLFWLKDDSLADLDNPTRSG